MYKYDIHVHTRECSRCGQSSVKDTIKAYKKAGFSGVVITNHFVTGNTAVDRSLPWQQQMQAYWSAVEDMRQYAAEQDFDLLFGIEHHYGGGMELLIYGIDYDFLAAGDDLADVPVEELAERVHAYGGFIIHAHPFRIRGYIDAEAQPNAAVCDGAEVYNASNYPIENEAAATWAEQNGLLPFSGSDSHAVNSGVVGKAGMVFDRRITDEKDLARLLASGEGRMIIDGEVK